MLASRASLRLPCAVAMSNLKNTEKDNSIAVLCRYTIPIRDERK